MDYIYGIVVFLVACFLGFPILVLVFSFMAETIDNYLNSKNDYNENLDKSNHICGDSRGNKHPDGNIDSTDKASA